MFLSRIRFFLIDKYKEIGYTVLFTIPFLVYLSYVFRYAINVPMHDDYDMILGFLNAFIQAETFRERIHLVFLQQNEHRVIVLKSLTLFQYWITGKVNFRIFLILGNLALFAIILILARQFKKNGLKGYQLGILPFLLLSPVSSENMNFVGGQIYIWGALFGFLFFNALKENKRYWVALLYPLSIFTMAGGFILFPIGNVYLILKKRWKEFWIFIISSTFFTLIYFYDYQKPAHLPRMQDSFLYFNQVVKSFFAFLGSALFAYEIALIIGVLMAFFLVLIAITSFDHDSFLSFVSIWLILNAGVVAIGRSSNELGIGYLPPRYALYSLLALGVIVLWVIQQTRSVPKIAEKLSYVILIGSIGYFCVSLLMDYMGNIYIRERDRKVTGLVSLARYDDPSYLVFPLPLKAKSIFQESKITRIYDFSTVMDTLLRPVDAPGDCPTANSDITGIIDYQDSQYFRGWALIPSVKSSNSNIQLLFRNGSRCIEIRTYPMLRPDVSAALGMPVIYDYSGYEVYLGAYAIPPGTYRLGIMVENQNQVAIQWEDYISIAPYFGGYDDSLILFPEGRVH